MRIIQMHNTTVSQMMGYFLVTDHGKVIAIDGGTRGDVTEFYRLAEELGGRINLWILTHPHSDHVGVFWEMEKAEKPIPADLVCYSPAVEGFTAIETEARSDLDFFKDFIIRCGYSTHVLEVGERFTLDNVTIEILRVVNPSVKKDWVNNLSVVFRVTEYLEGGESFSMLFLGDLGNSGGAELLENYNGEKAYLLEADAVQMAHHGQDGVEQSVYEAIHPRWAFWPTPDWLWSNTPKGEKEGSGPWKTLEVRSWMEKLDAHAVTSMETHTIFDTVQEMKKNKRDSVVDFPNPC